MPASETFVVPKPGMARVKNWEVEVSNNDKMLIRTDRILVNHRTSYEDILSVYVDLLTVCIAMMGVLLW